MAISYSLDLATPSPTAQVASELHDIARAIGLFDASVTPERVLDAGAATGLGTWTRVVEATPRPWNAVIADLGFTPTVFVVFRLGKDSEAGHQQTDMIKLVSGRSTGCSPTPCCTWTSSTSGCCAATAT